MKFKGRPAGETPKAVIKHILTIAPPSNLPEEDPTPEYHHVSDVFIDKLCCVICTYLLDRPLEISCGAVVCLDCCCKWIQVTSSVSCPCCYDHPLNSSTIQPPSPLVTALLDDLLISCKRSCKTIVRASKYKYHLASNCQEYCHKVLDSPSQITIEDVLAKPATSPATPAEIRATGHLVRRIMHQNAGSAETQAVVKVSTRGQVSKVTLIIAVNLS